MSTKVSISATMAKELEEWGIVGIDRQMSGTSLRVIMGEETFPLLISFFFDKFVAIHSSVISSNGRVRMHRSSLPWTKGLLGLFHSDDLQKISGPGLSMRILRY